MTTTNGDIRTGFRLGDWQAYPLRNLLVGPAGEVHVEPKVMQLLECLAASSGEVVERDRLLDELWGGRAVSDEPLTRCIATLRRVLDDSPKDPAYVQTIPKRGYRLVCPVEPLLPATQEPAAGPAGTSIRRRLVAVSVSVLALAAAYTGYQALRDDAADAPQVTVDAAMPAAPPVHSIAVLPFANLSPDPDNEYLSDGLAAELLDRLTAIPELRVAARTSAFAFKGKDTDVAEIARQLRVAHVLAGSVRQSGDRLRISVQLVEADGGYHAWSETWERPFTDIFEIQDEVAAAVVDSLRVELLSDISTAERADPDAYKLYLQGKEAYVAGVEPDIGGRDPTRQEEALSLVTHSLAIDPDYAPAWSLLAAIRYNQALWMATDPAETFDGAKAAAERALRLDPGERSALTILAALGIFRDRDYESAARWFRQALDVSPGHPETLERIAVMYTWLDRAPPAFVRDAARLDPLNAQPLLNEALGSWRAGRFEEARGRLEDARRLSPDAIRLHVFEALFAFHEGNFEEAASLAAELNPQIHLCALHRLGRHEEAEAGLDAIRSSETRSAFAVANVYACWGDKDAAFDWLQRADEEGDWALAWIRDAQLFEKLHDDPRWEAMLRRVGVSDDVVERVDRIIRGDAI